MFLSVTVDPKQRLGVIWNLLDLRLRGLYAREHSHRLRERVHCCEEALPVFHAKVSNSECITA